ERIPWDNYAFGNEFPDDIIRSGKFSPTDFTSMSTRCHHFYESVDPILHTNFIILLRIAVTFSGIHTAASRNHILIHLKDESRRTNT
ncbi:hypothetical protein WUBG_16969, partial [Wuchereria bancrofti]